MNTLLRALAALVLTTLTAHGLPAAAADAEPAIPPSKLREDLRVMRGVLEESHAGLYWFIPRLELERRFRALSSELVRPMTAREFHRRLLPLVASLRHGHTTLTLPVRGVGYRLRHLSEAGRYLPFEVRVLNGRLYVLADLSEGVGVAPGAEIAAVDGRPARALIARMRRYLSADGANDTFKVFQLGPGFQFHYLLDLLYGPSDSFALDLIPAPGGRTVRRVVPAQPLRRMADLYRQRTGREIDAYPPALGLSLPGDGVALLTVGSFYEGRFGPGGPSFEAFLASAFRRIKEGRVEDLIVDVRGNEGGNGAYPPLLYSYLAHAPFRLARPTTLASASLSYLAYAENPSDDVRAFAADPGAFVSKRADGAWVLKEQFDEERYTLYEPRPDRFTGRLYVLTDGGSFSATNDFLDLVYRYHRREGRSVRFVGEQNGGDNAFGWASGGQSLAVVLPNTGQRLSLPLLGSRRHFGEAVPRAVIPDDRVVPSIQDVLAGVDRELQFTRDLIGKLRREGVRRSP